MNGVRDAPENKERERKRERRLERVKERGITEGRMEEMDCERQQ